MRPSRARSRTVPLALALALLAGCKKPPAAGPDGGRPAVDAGDTDGGFLASCATGTDCQSGVCLASGRCSKACARDADCPAIPGWRCDASPAGSGKACLCLPTSATETCDGADDNCDGRADEDAVCPGLTTCQAGACTCPAANSCGTDCVDLATSALHCGTCDTSCRANEVCQAKQCVCPAEDKSCHASCAEVRYDDANCGDCDQPCAPRTECVEGTCQDIDPDWAAWTPLPMTGFAPAGDGVRDTNTGLTWSLEAEAPMSRADAFAWCDALAEDGQSWRLPTRIELLSLVDYTRANPALDPDAFPQASSGTFWTATPLATVAGAGLDLDGGCGLDGGTEADGGAGPASWWTVSFTDGSTRAYPESVVGGDGSDVTTQLLVRCVR